MQPIDLEEAKYILSKTSRRFDSQMYVQSIEEHYDGELYKVFFQRGYHSYILEVEGERFASWFSSEDQPEDMIKAIRLAAEELAT